MLTSDVVIPQGKFDIRPRVNFTDTLPAGLEYDAARGVTPVGTSPAGGMTPSVLLVHRWLFDKQTMSPVELLKSSKPCPKSEDLHQHRVLPYHCLMD